MTGELLCSLVTPQASLFSGPVWQVTAGGTEGKFSIRKGHTPIVASLAAGSIEIAVSEKDRRRFSVTGGILQHRDNICTIVCPSALPAPAPGSYG
jgi:F-type H+-transporting ATPase subunit epsilon